MILARCWCPSTQTSVRLSFGDLRPGSTESRPLTLLQGIIALVLAPTLIVSATAYVLKTLFQQGLERDVEKFKARLQSERDASQATLQAQLQAQLFEQQTRFSALHSKQSEVIAKTYELLFDPYEHILNYVHPVETGEPPTPEQVQGVIDLLNGLTGYYNKNRIFLPEHICDKMDVVLKEMKTAFNKGMMGRSRHHADRGTQLWYEAYRTMAGEVPPLMKELEREFRNSVSLRPFK
jgi:hypothetical protein